MIKSFACRDTEELYTTNKSRRFSGILRVALRKLAELDDATELNDLRTWGNRLESLQGDRAGQYSMRVNDKYRICFSWTEANDSIDVEIVDYH